LIYMMLARFIALGIKMNVQSSRWVGDICPHGTLLIYSLKNVVLIEKYNFMNLVGEDGSVV
jgi:hypothetical protein